MRDIVAEIHTADDAKPVALTPRRTPAVLEEQIKGKLDGLLRKRIIENSSHFSARQSPLVAVTKKSGEVSG